MNMKRSWNMSRGLALNNDSAFYFNLNNKTIEITDPKELRISKSIVTISKKIVRLEESVSRLDRLIKEGIV